VKVPSARHVLFSVNGQVHGLYLEYEDPDNKTWLRDKFADDTGDLYKAAFDLPNEPVYFGTTEYLGDSDANYLLHYNKKLNNNGAAEQDYALLRAFLLGLNSTPEAQYQAWLETHFDVEKFISYLVVGNFMSNWDSLPQRPKNYWLYEVRKAGRWVFIPWDMDATFQSDVGYLNPMGTDASIFAQFDGFEDYPGRHEEEGTERPLVRLTMSHEAFRQAYVARYREALETFLDEEYLLSRIDRLTALVDTHAPAWASQVHDTNNDIKNFVSVRYANVSAELAGI
jgi:spore coat protein CotH